MQRRDFVGTVIAGSTALGAPIVGPLMNSPIGTGSFVHCVYFWLKEDRTDEQKAFFEEGLASLATIESVRHCYYGTPAETDRDIIDRSYSYALVVVFDDEAMHDAYQVDGIHDVFRETYGDYWDEVKIYDFVLG